MEQDQLFERLWTGDAAMEEWTAAVSGGSAKPITDSVIAIHTGYLFGNASAVRTDAGLVLVDTGSRETASQTFAANQNPYGPIPYASEQGIFCRLAGN